MPALRDTPKARQLKQVTENNRWFFAFARIMNIYYHPEFAKRMISQTTQDVMKFGYEDIKQYWQKFMEFYNANCPKGKVDEI